MEINVLIASLIVFVVSIVLFLKKPKASASHSNQLVDSLQTENQQLIIHLAKHEERSEILQNDNEILNAKLNQERIDLAQAKQSLESLKAYYNAQKEKLAELSLERTKNQEKLNQDFELIASRILEEKTHKFTEQNRNNLDVLLTPLKENIKAFEEKVDRVYKVEADERNILKGVITQLMDLNKMMSVETQNLTRALKGDNKKQGNWGEMILERVLERSGLVKDQEYRVQASMQSADGNRFLPDVIIDLPDNKHLIVDSKVSLTAYARLIDCETEPEKDQYIKQHIASLRTHITDLSSKNYSDLYKINSPDFVMLFIPIESCFSIAVQKDAELFNYAWDKRVVIVSPSTLLATLRTIASIWKQDRQNRNVMEIARLSGEMYDKFVGFAVDMESIGKNIKQSHDAYDKAFNKLSTGRGNLSVTAEKIKKLGAKAGKQIDQRLLTELED
jgi:DNA recombination protein RmuC